MELRTKGHLIGARVLRSTISNSAGKFITLVSYMLLTPFILHSLGASQYGLWVLVGSAMAYGALLDFGILGAVIKYVAEYNAQKRFIFDCAGTRITIGGSEPFCIRACRRGEDPL